MKKLNLYDNNLGDDATSHISTCLSKIEELDIRSCNISTSGIKSISDAISKQPEPKPRVYGLYCHFNENDRSYSMKNTEATHLRGHCQAQARHQAECFKIIWLMLES
ncbi:unnamed protein product [Clavelina lepadiformis]|uniref:Uncharacterized protein n=1 Tax=Clavelina lepadiformis TaxID=159417 RepID=A0ABP0GA02_CLALP